MKKVFFLLVFAGLAVAVLHSCRKDGLDSQTPQPQQKTYSAQEMQIWRSLTAFNNKVKNGLRDEEFITPDSAMWYLEALYNATQTYDTTFNDLFEFERSYTLSLNEDGNVSMAEVSSVFNSMVAALDEEYGQLTESYKYSAFGDVLQASSRDGGLTLEFTGGIGINPLFFYDPITEDDNWRYGNMKGKCVNTQWDSDAGRQLKVRFNNPQNMVQQDTSGTWIQFYTTQVDYNNYPGRIYFEVANSNPCIPYYDLQYYLSEGHYIIHNTSSDIPSGQRPDGYVYRFMELWTNDDIPPATGNHYWHKYEIFYGYMITIPPID